MSINNYSIKCSIIGDSFIGKTTIINKYVNDSNNLTNATIGAIYWSFNKNKNGHNIKINLWDTAGQEKYHSLIPMYTRSCDIILLTFDLTNKVTLYNLKRWYEICNNLLNVKYIIIGNKSDKKDFIQVSEDMIENFIKDSFKEDIPYILTSGKTGENINELFDMIFDLSLGKLETKIIFNKENSNCISLNEEISTKKNCCY